jgi:plasmid stabilization system protein ParE
MDCKVIISARALQDLEVIVRYIATDKPQAAAEFGALLLAEAEAIGRFPLAGRVVPEFKAPNIRERIFRSIRIVYRLDAEQRQIVVARFWHGARDKPDIALGE